MAQAAPIIMIAATAYSVKTGMDAASAQEAAAAEAERIGRENAAIIEEETREEMKRTSEAQRQERGRAGAIAAASGMAVTEEGSVGTFLDNVDEAHTEALAWLQKSGANRARIAELGGNYTAMQGRAGASSTRAGVVSNVANSASNIYTAGTDAGWWT